MLVFRVLTPREFVRRYQRFGGTYCLHVQGWSPEVGGSMFLRSVCVHIQVHRASQPGIPRVMTYWQPWELQINYTEASQKIDTACHHTYLRCQATMRHTAKNISRGRYIAGPLYRNQPQPNLCTLTGLCFKTLYSMAQWRLATAWAAQGDCANRQWWQDM
jgi:hypothetical protein